VNVDHLGPASKERHQGIGTPRFQSGQKHFDYRRRAFSIAFRSRRQFVAGCELFPDLVQVQTARLGDFGAERAFRPQTAQ